MSNHSSNRGADSLETPAPAANERRTFLAALATFAMTFGLVGGYGFFATLAARFLFPTNGTQFEWLYVTGIARLRPGDSMDYKAPAGQGIAIARINDTGTVDDFIALSRVCPHLGCQVHWESQNDRFFCPCHNGAFDAEGNAILGPPKDAGQALSQYSLKVENGLLFIEVPTASLA